MRWKNFHAFIGFVTLSCLFSLFVFVSSCHAVDDYTLTIDKSNVDTPYYLCGNSSGIACSDYTYLSVSFSSLDVSRFIRLYYEKIGIYYRTADYYAFSPLFIVNISDLGSNSQISILSVSSYSGDVIYTFSTSLPGSCSSPSGTLNITENGSYDVTDYASVDVSVYGEVIQGDYHDDLVAITNGIYVCAGTLLVLYFFYTIYRLIIRNSGVK